MSDHDKSADDASLVSAEPAPVAVDREAWKADLWDWLERAGRRAGVPSLVIGIAALCVSGVGLSYIVANYRLAVASNRPYLVSNGLKADFDTRSLDTQVGLTNVGKVTARRGMLTLFSLSQVDADPIKLVVVPIVGAGTNIFPGYGSNARFDPHLTDKAPFLLACTKYFDDTGASYEQAFLFQRGEISPTTNSLPYSEMAPPDASRCQTSG
jgi:hypothetical protein